MNLAIARCFFKSKVARKTNRSESKKGHSKISTKQTVSMLKYRKSGFSAGQGANFSCSLVDTRSVDICYCLEKHHEFYYYCDARRHSLKSTSQNHCPFSFPLQNTNYYLIDFY